jgi:hypothetical protein
MTRDVLHVPRAYLSLCKRVSEPLFMAGMVNKSTKEDNLIPESR